ncbi:hypothetical protein [Kribbella solani]|uniref:Uncharacterized protein n=1 Tax=Kribbella solani TaxID=236067 RepID=A0A841DT31_9ACTN|nr:hypothetical protein [Kribbella solani]MBB5981159.1 hypothetical protein [Kribbella solani]
MGLQLPGWLKAILEGGYEPQADEDALYALADQYDACAKYLCGPLAGQIDVAAGGFGSAYHGEAGVALEAFLRRYAHDASLSGPATLADGATHLAEFLRTMGDTIVRTKRELLIIGIVSVATILFGLGPITGTLIRKLGQEGVKRLILQLVKKLVNREARKLQAKMIAELAAQAAKQTGKFVFSKQMVPKALGVVGAELADEVIPYALAGLWGQATGQDRRLVVDSHGQPVRDDKGNFVTTDDWDWRGTAMTAVGAVVGVPLSHGVGIGLSKVPGVGTVSKLAKTFVNNAITSPLASSLTSLGFQEGWHNPSIQDIWIAGAHGAARNSTPSDAHGPLESLGEKAGEWLGHKIVGHAPADPGGPQPTPVQTPATQTTTQSTTLDTPQNAAQNANQNVSQTLSENSSQSIAQNAAQNGSQPTAGLIGGALNQSTPSLSNTAPQATRTLTQPAGNQSTQQSRPDQLQPLRRPQPTTNPPEAQQPTDPTTNPTEAQQPTTTPTTQQPANPTPQPTADLTTQPTDATTQPTTPATPAAQPTPSAQADPTTPSQTPATATQPATQSQATPPTAQELDTTPATRPVLSADEEVVASPAIQLMSQRAREVAATPSTQPVLPAVNGGGAGLIGGVVAGPRVGAVARPGTRGGAGHSTNDVIDHSARSAPARPGLELARLRRGGEPPRPPGKPGRLSEPSAPARVTVADNNQFVLDGREMGVHELASLVRAGNPEVVVAQSTPEIVALVQKLANVTGQEVVLRVGDQDQRPDEDAAPRAEEPDGGSQQGGRGMSPEQDGREVGSERGGRGVGSERGGHGVSPERGGRGVGLEEGAGSGVVVRPVGGGGLSVEGVVVREGGKWVRKPREGAVSGMEVEVTEGQLGVRVGVGRSKSAFAFYDKVVLVAHPGVSLAAEVDRTNELRTLPGGADVIAPIHARTSLFGRDAIVVDRFAAASHDVLDEEAPDPDSRLSRPGLPTRATLESLEALRTFAIENKVLPGDLQFAISPDGRFRAYDVDGIRAITGPEDPALTTLDAWITWARTQLGTPATDSRTAQAPAAKPFKIQRRQAKPPEGGTQRGQAKPFKIQRGQAKSGEDGTGGETSRLANSDGTTGMSVSEVEVAVAAVWRRMRLPLGIRVRVVVGPDAETLTQQYGLSRTGPWQARFRMENGIGVAYLAANEHVSPADVAASVWHEIVGHFGWRLFSPETRYELLDVVRQLRHLDPDLANQIDRLYADQPGDVRDEEFLAWLSEGGVPSRLRQAWNSFLTAQFGTALHRIGAISNETLEQARYHQQMEPLYKIIRALVGAIRQNRPLHPAYYPPRSRALSHPEATTEQHELDRRPRVHGEQPRGGAGSIHRSEFRGDGRRTPDAEGVRAAAQAAAPRIGSAVAAARGEAADVTVEAERVTITLDSGEQVTALLDVSGDFTNAGPVRWERTSGATDWARITVSPRARDEVVGRAVANAVAGVLAAYRGESPAGQVRAGRRAEIGYLLDSLDAGESPHHVRKELRLLLRHLNKFENAVATPGATTAPAIRDLPPLPRGLRRRVGNALHRNLAFTWLADKVMPRVDHVEDRITDPGVLRAIDLPDGALAVNGTPPDAVDRFVHRVFQHFAQQPEVAVGGGLSASQQKVLREQPLLRQLVERHGTDQAAVLGALGVDEFVQQVAPADQYAVAAVFAKLQALVDQREHAGSWRQRRTAARHFAELAQALGVIDNRDLRAALPHELAAAVAELEPGLVQRINRAIDNGVSSLPSLRAELILGFAETVPSGVVSAAVLANHGKVGLAAAVLAGATLAWPVRAVVNRYVESRDEQTKSNRRNYRRDLDEHSRAPQHATITTTIRTAYQQLLQTATTPTSSAVVPRAGLGVPEVKAPPLTASWWTYPLRSSVPLAGAALPMALVVPPLAVGATIGIAAAVVGYAHYRFAQHQATLDDERRVRDYQWRSWRQLVGELRRASDVLTRLNALSNDLTGDRIHLPTWNFDAPTDHTGRGVIPAKPLFAIRELLLGVVPLANRTASVYVQQQLAAATATVLEAMTRLGAIGAVSGVVEAFHAEANRHAFDRRVHNWLELLRMEVQTRSAAIADPVLDQLDHLLTNPTAPQTELQIPPVPPWSPVVHPDREATTNRRWYAVGAAAIGGTGVGVAAWMVHSFHLDPIYLDLAAVAGAFQPVSYYAKYLRRRMRVKADLDVRDRSAEQRAATELDRERSATTDAVHQVNRVGDVIDGKAPRNRPEPTTDLGRFIESERRDLDLQPSSELSRLLTRLTGLDEQRRRLLNRFDQGLPTELHELTEVYVAISSALSDYADAAHKVGLDPHVRLGGPENRPVSASVLHHDPLNGRNLTDLTWAGRHHLPSVNAENAALIAAKIQQTTNDRYGPLSLEQVRAHTSTGRRIVDIAADLIGTAERRRTPIWSSADARALAARVSFHRALTADQARAVPARLIQQEGVPLDWTTYAGLHATALHQQQTGLMDRAAARLASAAATDDTAKAKRHQAIAAACTAAARQAEHARAAWDAFRAQPSQATLQSARHEEDRYQQRLAASLPSKDVLQTATVSGRLPHLTALTEQLNEALAAQHNAYRFTPEMLHRTLRAETRRVLAPGGVVLTVGNDPQADVSRLIQFEITLQPGELQEVLDAPATLEEAQLGQLVQGGFNVGTTTTTTFGHNGSLSLGPALAALPETNPMKAMSHLLAPSVEYARSTGRSLTGGATEYGLPGAVEVIQGEVLRFRSVRPAWSWRMRTSAVAAWSAPQVVSGAGSTLDLGFSHSYTVGAPNETVTIERFGDSRRTELPEHVASRVDGLSDLADRAIAGLRQRLGSLDRVGHDQLRGLLTEDGPGRLVETTRPGGLTRVITNGGRPVAYARLETVAVWDRATLLSDSSSDHKVERLRVGFSGTSGGQTFSAGTSVAGSVSYAGTALTDLGTSSWDAGPSAKAGRSTGQEVTIGTGDTAIHPSVQRMQPTLGVKLRLEHRLTVQPLGGKAGFTLTTAGDAILRMPENDAFRYGLPVPADALVLDPDGRPRYGVDGRLLLRGDPQPTTEPIALPLWMQPTRHQIRGAGPALVQEFTGADETLQKVLTHLAAQGLVPAPGQAPTAAQLANLERVGQQLARHRLETGYDPAAQEGILFRLDLHRAGLPPEQHTYRIVLRPHTGDARLLGVSTGETVVNLDIGTNTTSRSGGWSRSLPWSAMVGFGNKPAVGQAGATPDGGPSYGRSSRGRSISWSTGSTVNRVSLTESTGEVAVFEVPHTLVVTEVTTTGDSAPIAEVEGAARLSIDREFCSPGAPMPSIAGRANPFLLQAATFQAVDAGDPVRRLTAVLPELARADSSALHHLSAFLNPRNLAARPELLTAPYRTNLMISPAPSNPAQAQLQHGVTTGQASLTIRSALENLQYVGAGRPVNGEINLTLQSSGISIGSSTGNTAGFAGSLGAVGVDGDSAGGSLGGSRSGNRSVGATETQIGGIERLGIRDGQQYQFWGDLVLEAELQAIGAAPRAVQLSTGAIMLTIPERNALRLYGRGELDLPATKLADAVNRVLAGELDLDRQTVVALFRRYTNKTSANDTSANLQQQLAAKLRGLTGLDEVAYPTLDQVLPAADLIAATGTEVTLPEHYTNSMGAAVVDESLLFDADGNEADLFVEVDGALGQSALDDPVLSAALRGDLAGLRWHGHLDDMLSANGFAAYYPTGGKQQRTIRFKFRYDGPVTIDGVPDEGGKENVLNIIQNYDYHETGRSVTGSTTYSGQAGAAMTQGASATTGLGTDLGTATTASSTEQNTRMTRSLWSKTKRVSRAFHLSVEIDGVEARTLTGRMTQLVPASVINAQPSQTVHTGRVPLPSGTVVEGTTADELFETVANRLMQSDLLAAAGVAQHRVALENMLSAAARLAAFERIASPEGHTMVQLPVPGRTARMIAVRVRAELTSLQLVADGTAQLGQIDRQQRITQLTTKSNRTLPAARSGGGAAPAVGAQVGASSGEQAGEKVTDTTGNRNETSVFETAEIVTVRAGVTYHLGYERRRIDRDGSARVDRTDDGTVTGTAYLTMFRHEYDALLGRPSTPGRTVAESNTHTAGSYVPADPSGPS